jgi:uncharacterized protein
MTEDGVDIIGQENLKVSSPIVILGFIEDTSLGLLTSSYIIEQEELHQVAIVKSVHIPPVTVFVGQKMRPPFRIYSNKDGSLIVITCEVPIDYEGLYEISRVLVKWLEKIKPREMVVIDGIPVKGIIDTRDVYVATEASNLNKFSSLGVQIANSAIISGIGGAVLNESIGKNISAVSLMTPTSTDIPDPEAVLSIITILNKVYNLSIKIDVLEDSVKKLHEQMNKIMDQYNEIQKNKSQKQSEQSMFG